MSRIEFQNPVMLFAEELARPLEEVAHHWRALASQHAEANDLLLQQSQSLTSVLGNRASVAFGGTVVKQHQYTKNITDSIRQLADLHEQGAQLVRDAAHLTDSLIGPYLTLVNHIMDRLTPDLIVREGESPIHAVCEDLRRTVHEIERTGGQFFSDIFHLHFSAALTDVQQEASELGHLVGDALAALAAVEPVLARWAAQTQEEVFRIFNQGDRLLNSIIDQVFGISDIMGSVAILCDPNALPQERAMAIGMIALTAVLDITMFIPGADIGSLAMKGVFKLAEKTLLKDLLETGVKDLLEKGLQEGLSKLLGKAGPESEHLLDRLFSGAEGKEATRVEEELIKDDANGIIHLEGDGPPGRGNGLPIGNDDNPGWKSARMNPQQIRYTQSTIRSRGPGYTVMDNIQAIRQGTLNPDDLPPIHVFQKTPEMNNWGPLRGPHPRRGPFTGNPTNLEDGQWYTLDNRRLYTFKEANVEEITVLVPDLDTSDQALKDIHDQRWKFTTPNRGQSVDLR
ncbi:hypothetical protein [Thermogemmatispora sp.]|uniref:hypothetical protein n=1 Tax=Thermogemmatispora sp. TaxID=1968838 RepID=UPI0035E416A8